MEHHNNILGLPYSSFLYSDALNFLLELAVIKSGRKAVFTPNVHHFYLYHNNSDFKKAYDDCAVSLLDGKPLVWLVKLLNKQNADKISGSDVVIDLIKKGIDKKMTLYVLGGKKGVAKRAIEKIYGVEKAYPFAYFNAPPMEFEKNSVISKNVIEDINLKKPDILFVALGAPKQEIWISENLKKLEVGIAIGVGGSLDFIAGVQKRAPIWMQEKGLEWLFRLFTNPKRLFKRYLVTNAFFLWMVLKVFANKMMAKTNS